MWEVPCLHCPLLLHSTIILPVFKSHASMIKGGNEVLALNRHRIIPPTDSVEDESVAAESLFASTIRTLEKVQLFPLPRFGNRGESSTSFSHFLTSSVESRFDFFFSLN